MPSWSVDGLTVDEISDASAPKVLQLVWRGTSRDRQPQKTLGPYLASSVAAAAERGCSIEMRFDNLEYFNSGTVMAIIQMIHKARNCSVRLRIVYDASVEWQRLSFEPMRVLAKGDLLHLEARGAT